MLRKVIFFTLLYVAAVLTLIPSISINLLTIPLAFAVGYALVISPLDMPALWMIWKQLAHPYDRIVIGKVKVAADRVPDLHFIGKIEEEL